MSSTDFYFQLKNLETPIYKFAMSLTRSVHDTEDLMQETIYKALSNLDKFQRGTNFKAWMMTIMRNIFINNYRKNKKWKLTEVEERSMFQVVNRKNYNTNFGETIFLQESIASVLQNISEKLVTPFLMYAEGYKYDEIADKLSIPSGTVKSRIFKARKLMQEQLQALDIHSSNVAA